MRIRTFAAVSAPDTSSCATCRQTSTVPRSRLASRAWRRCTPRSFVANNLLQEPTAMPLVEVGKKAPAFSLKDQNGKTHALADYAGRPVILYFYPKDDTPGCTKESCAFRDNLPKFKTSKAVVLGASILDEASKA